MTRHPTPDTAVGPGPAPGPAPGPSPGPSPGQGCTAGRDAFGILLHCHERIGETLDVLANTCRALLDGGSLEDRWLARLAEVLAFLDTAIPIHTADEEQTLFPRLRRLPEFAHAGGTPMDCMEHEHVGHRDLRAQLKRTIVSGDPTAVARAGMALVHEYRGHIDKENGILFPMARQLITEPAEIDAMTAEMRARREQLAC